MGVREKRKNAEFDRIYCETLLEKRPEFMQTLEECLEILKAADRAAEEFFRSLEQGKNRS